MVFNGTGATGIAGVLQGASDLSRFGPVDVFGLFLLITIFSIVFFALGREPTREKMTAAAFVTMVSAILLRVLGVSQDSHVGFAIAIFLLSLIMLVNKK